MDYRACIQKSIDYIEEHLQACITVDDLANIAGFSPYHYYRIFNIYVGIPVMEYIRRRRLAYAASALASDRRIIDIALDYGFETHNGFAKAFRKAYGCSPEQYRIHASGQIPPKVDLLLFTSFNLKGAIVVEPKIVVKPASKIAGYELQTTCRDGKNFQEIPAFWGSMTPEKINVLVDELHSANHNLLGICLPQDKITSNFSYVIAVEVNDYEGASSELFQGEIPAATYAVFAVPPVASMGPEFSDSIQGTWKYINHSWFPESGYEYAEGKFDYEVYHEEAGGVTPKVEIYIPITKKA
jgi:AraC family transcriptional regulator